MSALLHVSAMRVGSYELLNAMIADQSGSRKEQMAPLCILLAVPIRRSYNEDIHKCGHVQNREKVQCLA